jgi:hypothetical protein
LKILGGVPERKPLCQRILAKLSIIRPQRGGRARSSVRHGTDRFGGLSRSRLRPPRLLAYVDAVVRHGSIRKAAEFLNVASSALNRQILDLEADLGSALFERLPRGVRLTAAGERCQERTRASHNVFGRIERGFDFLGYHFSPMGLTAAQRTIANFIEKASRLYEQKRSAFFGSIRIAWV